MLRLVEKEKVKRRNLSKQERIPTYKTKMERRENRKEINLTRKTMQG